MATENRRTADPVIEQLRARPQAFGFFQALRILQRYFDLRSSLAERRFPVGHDFQPIREIVRFQAVPSLSFPASEILGFRLPESPAAATASAESAEDAPPRMAIGFMGLVGPSGVLPRHYTQTVIDEAKGREGTPTGDFFDLFTHRIVSLFYRAWEKYRLPVNFENAQWGRDLAAGPSADAITACLYALIGLGPAATRRRQAVDDSAYLFYSGLFAARPRQAVSLRRILGELFQLPVRVEQFRGEWLQLEESHCSRLQSFSPSGSAANNRLGWNTVAGSRVWSCECLLRIRIGPVSYPQFCELLPGGEKLQQISQFVRQYVGTTLETEYQIVLAQADVPHLCLSQADPTASPPRLGRNTWLLSGAADRDRDDAVIRCSGRLAGAQPGQPLPAQSA